MELLGFFVSNVKFCEKIFFVQILQLFFNKYKFEPN